MSQFDINKFLVENKITTNSKIIKEGSSPHDYDKGIRKKDSTKYRRKEDQKVIEKGSRLSNPFHILDAVHKFNEKFMKDKVEYTDQIGDTIGARATDTNEFSGKIWEIVAYKDQYSIELATLLSEHLKSI